MLRFRPLWAFTFASAVLFAILVGLGVWQLERLQWKLALIAEVHRHLAEPPISLSKAMSLGAAAEYRHVALTGRFDNAKEAYVFSTGAGGGEVYHVVVPFHVEGGGTVPVDRGIVPKEKLDPKTRRPGQLAGIVYLIGVWRTPDAPGFFTPAPDRAHRIWYARDLKGIAAADGVRFAAPVLVEADAAPNPGGWPKGGQTVVAFRNEHLQYAITWFGLAVVLLAVYVAYHVSRGRLSLR